jgi:hypothetical protein
MIFFKIGIIYSRFSWGYVNIQRRNGSMVQRYNGAILYFNPPINKSPGFPKQRAAVDEFMK